MSGKAPGERPPWAALLDSDDLRRDVAAIFDEAFLRDLANLMGIEPRPADYHAIGEALYDATSAYLDGRMGREDYLGEKVENRALQRVADKAQQLHDALLDLYGFGRAERKLAAEIKSFEHWEPGSTPAILSQLASRDPANPLLEIRDLVADVTAAAERAINQKPSEERLEMEEAFSAIRAKLGMGPSEERWRRRSAEHRLAKDHGLQKFIATFRSLWQTYSDRPFTEGMHYAEIGATVSNAVDALELIFARLDPAVERTAIVNAMRKLRKSERSSSRSS